MMPDGILDDGGVYPADAWLQCTPAKRRFVCQVNPALYDDVIDQFAVTLRPRYQPRDGNTYCNIFAADVMNAMAAQLPEGTANNIVVKLAVPTWGGWEECNGKEALENAGKGWPTIAAWGNPKGHGHVVVVRPSHDATPRVRIAQAGRKNIRYGTLEEGFGAHPARFWRHA